MVYISIKPCYSSSNIYNSILRKIVATSNNQQQQQRLQTTLFSSRVLDKPFWIWNIEEHKVADIITDGDCCLNLISAQLHRGITGSSVFVAYVVFESAELLKQALNNPVFLRKLSDYPASTVSSASLFKKLAVPRICVD
jgi:hypothetical protein